MRSEMGRIRTDRDWAIEPDESNRKAREGELTLRCPACGSEAGVLGTDPSSCRRCGFRLVYRDGILSALAPGKEHFYARFLQEYTCIRKAEKRGSDTSEYYLALPYDDVTGAHRNQWRMRGRTFRHFQRHVLPLLEQGCALRVLDLGAGTGWLSYRLAQLGHRPVALDITVDSRDGLGAAHHYGASLDLLFPVVQAEFDNIPFDDGQFDLAVFNSSLHYSTDYAKTLREARRCLKPGGSVVVLDSPIYRKPEHGLRMRQERHQLFQREYGISSDSIPSIEFLDDERLAALTDQLAIRWRVFRPWYGWQWHLRPLRAAWNQQRPPSRFQILVGSWTR